MNQKAKWQLSPAVGLHQAYTLACLVLDHQAESAPDSLARNELLTARQILAQEKARRFRSAQTRARRQAA